MAEQAAPATRKNVDQPRQDFEAMLQKWVRCLDVLEGQDAVKARGSVYLPMLDGQTQAQYDAYKTRALFFNGTERTRFALVGSVFRKDITVVAPDVVTPDLQDINLDGLPLNDFAMSFTRDVIGTGREGILIDMPDETTATEDRRPYWTNYHATQILNWRRSKRGAVYVTSLLVLKESIEEPDTENPDNTEICFRYRRFELKDLDTTAPYLEVTLWQESTDASTKGDTNKRTFVQVGATMRPQRKGAPLDFIPFIFCNSSHTDSALEKPPLLDMVDVNLSHYRSSADLEHGEHFLGLPTPWVNGLPATVNTVPLGPTNVLKLTGPNAQAGFLEFKGEGLKQLESALDRKEEQMAVLGARLIGAKDNSSSSRVPETAESVKTKNAGTHATLATITGTVSNALTQALRWHVWWRGLDVADDQVTVTLNKEFVAPTLTSDDVKNELLRWQAGGSSFETFYYILSQGGRTRPDVPWEDELKQIQQEEEQRVARLAATAATGIDPTTGLPIPAPKPAPTAKPQPNA